MDYFSMLRLDGQGIIVLGAGAGMGRRRALRSGQAGAECLCVDRDMDLAASIAAKCGGKAFAADVTTRDGMEAIFAEADSRFGARLKGLVDIVGVATIKPTVEFSDADFDAQYAVVLRHAMLALQLGAPRLAANGGGAMTFIGSNSGMKSVPNQAVYGSAKAALHHFVRCGARDFAARKVRMNVVAPSFIRTPRLAQRLSAEFWAKVDEAVPMGRAGTVDDVASVVLFLQSELAGYVTGNVMTLDGGSDVVAPIPTP